MYSKQRIEQVTSGAFSKEQLQTLRTNAIAKGGNDELVEACDKALAQIARTKGKGKDGPDHVVAERRSGFAIMVSGLNNSGSIADERLLPLAAAVSKYSSVKDVAVLKTQIRFYYKGHHMVCGVAAKGGYFIGVLNEQKITDTTLRAWEEIGPIGSGIYFSTKYINVVITRLDDVPRVLGATTFVV
jgi:hypothetical protein